MKSSRQHFFNIYLYELNATNLGIQLGNKHICILLNADDIVNISENEHLLQTMLDILNNWCCKWRLLVNETKSNIVHYRNNNKKQIHIGSFVLKRANKSKCLGMILVG